MKVYKGTDKDMKCRGFQYRLGEKVVSDDAIRCGNKGFHSCEAPLDVLKYYPMRDGNRYFVAEADGKIDKEENEDSKLASSELTLKAEIKLADLVKEHFKYTRKKAESGKKCGNDSTLEGGDRSNLAGGDRSTLAGGNDSTLAGGKWSTIAGGDKSLVCGREKCKVKGGMHSVLVMTEWSWENNVYKPVAAQAVIVDGVTYKPDVWYQMKDGKIVEVEA